MDKSSVITRIDDVLAFQKPVGVSDLGTPIIDNLKFNSGSYPNFNGQPVAYPELILNNVMLVVNRSKRIVESIVNGQAGTKKEYITAGDYIINVSGYITSAALFPAEKWQAFKKLEDVPAAIRVNSKFLALFGIDYVVIRSMSAQQKGSVNSYPITMELVSDTTINFGEKFGA